MIHLRNLGLFKTILLIFSIIITEQAIAQDCPIANTRKNSSCISVTYATQLEAQQAINNMETLVVTNSTGGSADGTYIATTLCETSRVVYDLGSSSCNCQGYNGTTNGTFTFVEAGVTCIYNADGTLPVEYGRFEIFEKDKKPNLVWTTVSEVNNDGFEIEHSFDGKNFKKVGFVLGAGNSSEENAYEFIHRSPALGHNYYRLKQLDFNGDYYFSEILTFEKERNVGNINAFFTSSNEILFSSESRKNDIYIFDVAGRLVFKSMNVSGDEILTTTSLRNGIYILKSIDAAGITQTIKLTKSI